MKYPLRKYPLRGEYDTAVKNINLFVYDSVLKLGKPVMQKNNPNFLLSYNGGKAIVYEIKTNPKKYALKCWVEDLGDLQHGNIRIGNNGKICLIDYDSLFVPQLNNEKDNIKGIPGYQHPHRNKLIKLSSKSDYFSELFIYPCLY